MRLDVLLKSLCLVKTRSQGRKGCEAGRVKLNGLIAKPSREVRVGDIIEIQYAEKTLVIEVGEVPSGQVPRRQAAAYYRVVREAAGDGAGDRRF